MWLICARLPADTVARAHRGEAFINRRATRSSTADENLRERRSTVTCLVCPLGKPNVSPIPRLRRGLPRKWGRRRDGDDFAVVGLDQLPPALMHHPVMPGA